jgi:hypothetical protein
MAKATRRGSAASAWCVVAALLAVAILASVSFLGTATRRQIDEEVNGADGVLGRQADAARNQ